MIQVTVAATTTIAVRGREACRSAPDSSRLPGQEPDVVVFGQVARDLVLVVDAVPGPGRSASVRQRREMLGGNGANQAVSLAQLGMRPMLAGVIGEDQVGQRLLAEAAGAFFRAGFTDLALVQIGGTDPEQDRFFDAAPELITALKEKAG